MSAARCREVAAQLQLPYEAVGCSCVFGIRFGCLPGRLVWSFSCGRFGFGLVLWGRKAAPCSQLFALRSAQGTHTVVAFPCAQVLAFAREATQPTQRLGRLAGGLAQRGGGRAAAAEQAGPMTAIGGSAGVPALGGDGR